MAVDQPQECVKTTETKENQKLIPLTVEDGLIKIFPFLVERDNETPPILETREIHYWGSNKTLIVSLPKGYKGFPWNLTKGDQVMLIVVKLKEASTNAL